MYIRSCRAHLWSLAWPWTGRSLHKGNHWEWWDLGLGPNMVRFPVHLPPNIWPTQSLTGWYLVTWLVDWPITAGKLAGWLTAYDTKCQPDPPSHHMSHQPKAWQVDILLHGWLAGQLQLISWLTAYHTKCQPDPSPRKRHVVAMFCDYFGHKALWSRWTPQETI